MGWQACLRMTPVHTCTACVAGCLSWWLSRSRQPTWQAHCCLRRHPSPGRKTKHGCLLAVQPQPSTASQVASAVGSLVNTVVNGVQDAIGALFG